MKPRSAKTKGQSFQKEIVEILRTKYNLDTEETDCFNGDITARPMGNNGVDIILSPKARELFPYSIEAKRVEKINIWSAIQQAESNTKPNIKPLVVFRRNRSDIYACIKFSDLLELL